ncbi:hypothetical protein EDD11_001097 [Mortierella claussenii]|nr:hypothetical protein EDD11_001097 [Mortierella claussenii]
MVEEKDWPAISKKKLEQLVITMPKRILDAKQRAAPERANNAPELWPVIKQVFTYWLCLIDLILSSAPM